MTLESTIESYFKQKVAELGGMAIKFIPLHFAGFPDRIVLLPYGRIVFVELKAPGKKPRKLQAKIHKQLRDLGFTVDVIDSKEGVEKWVLREIGIRFVTTKTTE